MAARKKIALLYTTNYNNATGVVIYLQNLVKHFLAMDAAIQPRLIILYNSGSPIDDLKSMNYPFADYIKLDEPQALMVRVINKIGRIITGKAPLVSSIKADFAYPALPMEVLKNVPKLVYWKEDFQENYYPQYFSQESFAFVSDFFKALQSKDSQKLVLSSYAAGNDLHKFYPEVKNQVHYLRFVSLLPEINDGHTAGLMRKFLVKEKYFIVSNQFWPHKNHMLVLEAVNRLKKNGITDFSLVLTGKTSTNRDPDYFPSLQRFIEENEIGQQIVITGFLAREEQLLLMKNALAVIQPSLFEGWSTVIEDAKALGKYILAADLPVNFEQLNKNASFFEKHNSEQLADLMKVAMLGGLTAEPINYGEYVADFRKSLAELFELNSYPGSN